MITNNFNKELRSISDALRDLGYTDSTIGLRQRYWKEYCFFHGSLDIDEASMDEFLLKNYDIQSGNINVSKRQYEVRAALRNLLEYRRYGKSVILATIAMTTKQKILSKDIWIRTAETQPFFAFLSIIQKFSLGRVDIRRYSSVFLGSSLAKGTMAPPTLMSP